MAPQTGLRATLDDLSAVGGKAELIGGRIVYLMPAGVLPSRIAGKISRSMADNAGKAAPERYSGGESISPGAS